MTTTYDNCASCGVALTHAPGRGKAQKYCSGACRSAASAKRWAARQYQSCCVDGCDAKATRVGAQMCEKHYCRLRRNGTTEYVGGALPGPLVHSNDYLLVAADGHYLARGGYRAYEHRLVFHRLHGDGPFSCHWCGKRVTWDDMHVDHLDSDRQNNDGRNLVASCAICNQKRGVEKMKATARTKHGISFNGVTLTSLEWAKSLGICRSALLGRLDAGWPLEKALTQPRGRFGPKSRGSATQGQIAPPEPA